MNGAYRKGDRVVGEYGSGTCMNDSFPFGGGFAVNVWFDCHKAEYPKSHGPLLMLEMELRRE